jgi:hypothetical protein
MVREELRSCLICMFHGDGFLIFIFEAAVVADHWTSRASSPAYPRKASPNAFFTSLLLAMVQSKPR